MEKFKPKETILTKRTVLIKREHDHDKEMFEAIEESRDFIREYLFWVDGTKTFGDVVKATVKGSDEKGVIAEVDGAAAYIKKADLSKDKSAQNPENYNEGDVLEAKITSVDKKNGKLNLSVKALEIEEEKKALEEYSSATGNSALGDALGEALKKNA